MTKTPQAPQNNESPWSYEDLHFFTLSAPPHFAPLLDALKDTPEPEMKSAKMAWYKANAPLMEREAEHFVTTLHAALQDTGLVDGKDLIIGNLMTGFGTPMMSVYCKQDTADRIVKASGNALWYSVPTLHAGQNNTPTAPRQ